VRCGARHRTCRLGLHCGVQPRRPRRPLGRQGALRRLRQQQDPPIRAGLGSGGPLPGCRPSAWTLRGG
jgi:hypothetical protein